MNPNISNISFDTISNKSISLSDICLNHKEKYSSYCKLCSLDICNKCLCSHYNHELINYKKIKPKKDEIDLLRQTLKNYQEIFNNILSQIFVWKKFLEKIIISFQNELNKNQKINENINFIFNNNIHNYTNYNTILKFRQLFNSIIEPQKNINNNKILNYMINDGININNNIFDENKMGLYEYNNYNKIKICLEKMKHYNKDINNNNSYENNFLYNTNCIIDILYENYISKKNKFNNINNIYNNKNKKIIEKYIDLSQHKKISKNNFNFNFGLNKIQTIFKPNIGNIFLQEEENIINNNNNTPKGIYCKKRNNSNNNIFWNKTRKNISFNINQFNANYNINKINYIVKNESNNHNNNKNIDKINHEKIQKNKERTFIHKKFEIKNVTNLKKFVKNSSKKETNIDTNDTQKTPKILCKSEKNKIYYKNNFLINNSNSNNKLNTTSYNNSSDKIKQKLNFDFLGNDFTLLNNDLIKENEIIYKLPNNNNTNINNISYLSNNNIKYKYIYNLSPNQILCIGLELGNFICKLGLKNPNPNQKNNPYKIFDSIPFILSFNEDKDQIDIGQDALNSYINNNKTKMIFNMINLIGKKYHEINFDEIIYNKNNKPYIKINLNNKEKKYNFEDLFTIFIKKLFQNFFEKIEFKGTDTNIIQINLLISIPDNINYFQRKIIEKIFQTQIFPYYNDTSDSSPDNNLPKNKLNSPSINSGSSKNSTKKLYGGYQIVLKHIKIENASSIIHMSYILKEKNKNILALISNGNNINISLANIYKENIDNEITDIYEIKNSLNIDKGEIDLINDFIEKKKNSFNKDKNDINNLRKNFYKFFFENNKNNNNNIILLNDFIKYLNNIYKEIISSIINFLQKEKLNETDINHIIIEGKLLQTKSFLDLISNLFKNNKEIINDIKNITNNNIILGAIIESENLSKDSPSQILKNISPMSFGIDSLNNMEFIIKKGTKVPNINNKLVKIKNNLDEKTVEINIYEGENKEINKNKFISCINIDKKELKNENIYENYIELMIQFELDSYLNLKVFVLDSKNLKKKFECLIKFDIIKE